jgi:hypothetical protein
LIAGGAVGLALMSGSLSTVFLSSVFFSSFTGLAVGLAVTDGLDVATGEAITTGVDVGVVTTGFVSVVVDGWHAVPMAVTAAKTVSRIDLLIVFSLFIDRKAFFQGSRDRSYGRPRGFNYAAGCIQ